MRAPETKCTKKSVTSECDKWREFMQHNYLYFQHSLTPMTELSSDMVTCLARSTAVATCCWCSCDRNGSTCPTMADSLLTISD